MNITPRTPKTPFDFGAAITQLFRTPGGTPWAFKLILATGMILGLTYVLGGVLIAGPYLSMISGIDTIETNPEEFMNSFYTLIPGYILMTIGALFALALGESTLHRAVLREEDTPGIPLRLGRDELRVFGASLGVFLLGLLALIGVTIVSGVIGVILGFVSTGLGVFVFFVGYIAAFIVVWPFVAIRLAPAAGLSIYNDQAHLLAGRHVSKHRFWNMFLAYLVVGIVGYVASTVISLIGMMALIGDGSIFLMSGGEIGDGSGEEIADKISDIFSNPLVIIAAIIGAILYSCVTAAWLLSMAGVASYTVKWWAEEDQVSTFD